MRNYYRNINMLSISLLILVGFSAAHAATTSKSAHIKPIKAPNNQIVLQPRSYQNAMQQAINELQQQIQAVAKKVPLQLQRQQTNTDKKIMVLRKQTQQQFKLLHQQIQQVQNQMQRELATVQKEVHQMELLK